MKLTPLILLIISLAIFTSCDEETPVEEIENEQLNPETEIAKEITYFTFRPNKNWDTSETDDWVIIHDQSGKLLDYQAYEKDDDLVFKAIDTSLTQSERLVVTTFSARQNETSNSHNINTYTDLEKGFNWNIDSDASSFYFDNILNTKANNLLAKKPKSSSKSSTHHITVNNIPGIIKYNITSSATGVVTADYNPIDSNMLSLENLELLNGIRYIFFIGDAEGGLKHTFFEIDENITDLELNYDDFLDFEYVLETELPSNSYLFSVSRGHESAEHLDRGYEMTVELDFTSPDVSKIGYIPDYESFSTVFHITLENDYAYQYNELSAAPLQELNILEKPSFSVENEALTNFSFDTDIDFLRGGNSWKYEENFSDGTYQYTSWTVHTSNKTSHRVGSLPEEIVIAYPKLDLAKTEHFSTYFTTQGRNYETLLKGLSDPTNNDRPAIIETVILYHSQD